MMFINDYVDKMIAEMEERFSKEPIKEKEIVGDNLCNLFHDILDRIDPDIQFTSVLKLFDESGKLTYKGRDVEPDDDEYGELSYFTIDDNKKEVVITMVVYDQEED